MSEQTVAVCPDCGSSHIRTRSTGKPAKRSTDVMTRHYCRDCETPIEALEQREKETAGSRSGAAKRLVELTVDDVPALTDGGPDE